MKNTLPDGQTFSQVDDIYDKYSNFYDLLADRGRGDVGCYLELAAGCRNIIDIGCGTGRVTRELLLQGSNVVGLDLSQKMLAICEAEAAALDTSANLVLSTHDLVCAPLDVSADLAILSYFTFNYVVVEADQEAMLRNIASSLSPAGVIVMECFFPKSISSANGIWEEKDKVLSHEPLLVRSDWRRLTGAIEERFQAYLFQDDLFNFRSRRRFVTVQESIGLLEKTGFSVDWISFDFGKTKLEPSKCSLASKSFIIKATKYK